MIPTAAKVSRNQRSVMKPVLNGSPAALHRCLGVRASPQTSCKSRKGAKIMAFNAVVITCAVIILNLQNKFRSVPLLSCESKKRDYLKRLLISRSISLATLRVLTLAWKPFRACIILTNSAVTSALDFSSAPP